MKRHYKVTAQNVKPLNGGLRKFARSCILKHELWVSIHTHGENHSIKTVVTRPFTRRISRLPSNFRNWMICEIGDTVQLYGGNKVDIGRGNIHICLYRTIPKCLHKFVQYNVNDHILLTAINK